MKKTQFECILCLVAVLILGSSFSAFGVKTTVLNDDESSCSFLQETQLFREEMQGCLEKKLFSFEPILFDWGVDQKNIETSGYGITLHPPQAHAQGFRPTKDKLTAVSLLLFKGILPPDPVHITVSIREYLNGADLVTMTINTSVVSISKSRQWVLFDFEDVSVVPEKMYYIVCSADAGDVSHAYCWMFAETDTYARGEAFCKPNATENWMRWPNGSEYPVDFCFKTYFRKPLDGFGLLRNENLFDTIGSFPKCWVSMFPIVRHLIDIGYN